MLATVALALLQCRGWDGTVNGDGVSYLDLAGRYAHGHVDALANGYWSPLYPMLLGAAMRVAGVGGLDAGASLLTPELRVVFSVNVLVMAAASLALSRLLLTLHRATAPAPRVAVVWRVLAAAALFVWCTIRFIGTTSVTPDALLLTWLILLTAELVDAVVAEPSLGRTLRVSALLAAAYWTKAVFFPVAVVVLPVYLIVTLRHRGVDRLAHLARALAPALLLVMPLVIVQSASQGHLSFGETGRLNYRWYVLGAPHAPPTSNAIDDSTSATLALASSPAARLFRGDVPGTFPYWFDPSRFEPREPIAFSARAQWTRFAYNAHWYRVVATPFALLALIALAASLARARPSVATLAAALPALALMILYALTHVEGRLAGPPVFVALLVALYPIAERGGVPSALVTPMPSAAPWRRACIVVESIALVSLGVLALGRSAKRMPTTRATQLASPVAELRASGIAEGSKIGIVGSPYGHYWAHQGGLRLAVVTPTDGRSAPVSDAELAGIASEACARGTSLAAFVGRTGPMPASQAVRLRSGWWLWRPTSACVRLGTR
jgi:hypothetical protein